MPNAEARRLYQATGEDPSELARGAVRREGPQSHEVLVKLQSNPIRPPINLEVPGGYPEEVLKAAEQMKVAEIAIEKEAPPNEEDEARLQMELSKKLA